MKSKKIVTMVVQARMGSQRLKGKSMLQLAGEPLVGRILERLKRCRRVDYIVLAIPKTDENLVLRKLAKQYKIFCYQGSENNLVDRFYNASKIFNTDIVVRFPADNPVPEPDEIDKIIQFKLNKKIRCFASNISEIDNSGYPDGIGAEVFDFSYLEELIKKKLSAKKKEHIHLNFFNYETKKIINEDWCPVFTINCPKEFKRPELILDVNTIDQYNFIRSLYEYLYPRKHNFHIADIIKWYDNIYINNK